MKCLKLGCLCIKSGSPKKNLFCCGVCKTSVESCIIISVYVSRVDHGKKVVKLRRLYIVVFKVALYMYQERITKEKVVKLRSLYIKGLKLRFLCIKSGSQKEKLISCGVWI